MRSDVIGCGILLNVIDSMAASDISLFHVDSSENEINRDIWSCLAQRTGGEAIDGYGDGAIPPGIALARRIEKKIKSLGVRNYMLDSAMKKLSKAK